jgi:hypothetical protein
MFSGSILRGGYQRIVERKPYQDIFLNPKSVAVVGATERPGEEGEDRSGSKEKDPIPYHRWHRYRRCCVRG